MKEGHGRFKIQIIDAMINIGVFAWMGRVYGVSA